MRSSEDGCTAAIKCPVQGLSKNLPRWISRLIGLPPVRGRKMTSRKPADVPAFNRKMIEEFEEGMHGGQIAEFTERIHVPER